MARPIRGRNLARWARPADALDTGRHGPQLLPMTGERGIPRDQERSEARLSHQVALNVQDQPSKLAIGGGHVGQSSISIPPSMSCIAHMIAVWRKQAHGLGGNDSERKASASSWTARAAPT